MLDLLLRLGWTAESAKEVAAPAPGRIKELVASNALTVPASMTFTRFVMIGHHRFHSLPGVQVEQGRAELLAVWSSLDSLDDVQVSGSGSDDVGHKLRSAPEAYVHSLPPAGSEVRW